MLSSCNLFKCFRRRRRDTMGCDWPASASEHRYSDAKGHFWRAGQPVQTALAVSPGGRGPPGRRSRFELQALSNSLQLTSI
jgi:hypothetical protein